MATPIEHGFMWEDLMVTRLAEYKGNLFLGLKRGDYDWIVRVSPTGKVVTVETTEVASDKKTD